MNSGPRMCGRCSPSLARGLAMGFRRQIQPAFAPWKQTDRRFRRMAALYRGPRVDLLAAGQTFQIRRHGEDPRFAGGPIRTDARLLRDRRADVMTPEELAQRHPAYRWRIIIGP